MITGHDYFPMKLLKFIHRNGILNKLWAQITNRTSLSPQGSMW